MNHSEIKVDEVIGGILIILLLRAAYLLPTIIAVIRKHKNKAAIGVVNIALGWTFLGYIFALVWSLTSSNDRSPIVINQIAHQPPQAPQAPARTPQLLASRTIEAPVIDVLSANQNKNLKSNLEELKDLIDSGLISEEEYQAKRKNLLS